MLTVVSFKVHYWMSACVCRVFVDQCFRPFSAALLDDGVYKTLCKETNRYVQDVNSAVEQLVFLLLLCYSLVMRLLLCCSLVMRLLLC